jgi:hypothetical protein
MNPEYPPLRFRSPQMERRKKEKPRFVPLSQDLLIRRQEIARRLVQQINPLSRSLQQMSDAERRAVFYKLEHERPISLVGTDLKPFGEHSDHFTLAVPKTDNLTKLAGRIESFGSGEIRRGHAPNEMLAARIANIHQGDPKDRLSEALFIDYDRLTKQDWIVCEIEMISLASGPRQKRVELQEIRAMILQAFASNTNGNFFEQEETGGTCRAVIRCSGKLFKGFVEQGIWHTRISWFDARPQFETFHTVLRDFSVGNLGAFEAPEPSAPMICVIDSGVSSGNPFLSPVCKPDYIRSFLHRAPTDSFDENGHGSGIASLASYYAINIDRGASNSGKVWIASARVLDADNQIEEERLFSAILAEVVEAFVQHGVRIFNLSINVINRMWNAEAKRTIPRQSWIARTIDRLSREKDIVFLVSTGNIAKDAIAAHHASGKPYPYYLSDEECTILDPAQAALALTVGSVSPGTLVVGPGGAAAAIAARGQPSPFTRRGPGINGEIKPEIVDFGGNYVLDPDGGQVRANPGTDVMMASHQESPALSHDSGSSFAAPRVAHKLALILGDLESLGVGSISAALLKAFLVNSASWSRLGIEIEAFRSQLDELAVNLSRQVVGYGMPDADFATSSDANSAILYYQGILAPDSVAYFDVPVPAALSATGNGIKRLTVTLVHSPEVQRWGLERYLGTSMKWRIFRGDVDRNDVVSAMSEDEDEDRPAASPRPDELHSLFGVNARSRGCVQHDVIEWSRHQEEYSATSYTLAIASYQKWQRVVQPIPYALVVRLEDTSRIVQVYTEVQNILTQLEIELHARS